MRIVDAHHHIWIPEQETDIGYVWLKDIGAPKPFGDPTPIQRDYTWQEFSNESQQHELCGSVFLQTDGGIGSAIAETEWASSAIELPEGKFGLVGFVDLRKDDAEAMIETQKKSKGFKGVRQIISYLEDNPALCFSSEHLLRHAQWCDQYSLLAEHDLSFDLQLYPEQMLEAAEFLAQHPNVPVVIDHSGSPHDQSDEGLTKLKAGLMALSQLPHVQLKLSGLGMFDKYWSAASVQPIIDIAVVTFGFDRIMFGSNFPVDKLMASYDDCVQRLLDCIQSANDDELAAVFEKNAQQFYRLS